MLNKFIWCECLFTNFTTKTSCDYSGPKRKWSRSIIRSICAGVILFRVVKNGRWHRRARHWSTRVKIRWKFAWASQIDLISLERFFFSWNIVSFLRRSQLTIPTLRPIGNCSLRLMRCQHLINSLTHVQRSSSSILSNIDLPIFNNAGEFLRQILGQHPPNGIDNGSAYVLVVHDLASEQLIILQQSLQLLGEVPVLLKNVGARRHALLLLYYFLVVLVFDAVLAHRGLP